MELRSDREGQMILRLISMLGLKFLAKKIALIVLNKVVYSEIRELVRKSDNKIDDEIAEAVIKSIDDAVKKF